MVLGKANNLRSAALFFCIVCFLLSATICLGETAVQSTATQPAQEAEDVVLWRIKQEYQDRLKAAKTKEEGYRIQAEIMTRVYQAELDRMSRSAIALKGQVVDQDGNPLDNVKLDVKKYVFRTPGGDMSEKPPESEIMTINKDFDISYKDISSLHLDFIKDGYYHQLMILSGEEPKRNAAEFARLARNGALAPSSDKDKVRLVLEKMGMTTTLQKWTGLAAKDNWQTEVLDFASKPRATPEEPRQFRKIISSKDVPSNCTAALMDRNAETGAILRQKRPGSYVRDFPEGVALYINANEGGFILYEPRHPLFGRREMKQAPETGYKPEMAIPTKSLKQLALNDGDHDPERFLYFFFKTADGKYGKGTVTIAGGSSRDEQSYLSVLFYLQPDGSRNLEDPKLEP